MLRSLWLRLRVQAFGLGVETPSSNLQLMGRKLLSPLCSTQTVNLRTGPIPEIFDHSLTP